MTRSHYLAVKVVTALHCRVNDTICCFSKASGMPVTPAAKDDIMIEYKTEAARDASAGWVEDAVEMQR